LQNINEKVQKTDAGKNLQRVKEIQKNHQNQRDRAIKNINRQQTNRRATLQLRLQARKKVKRANALLKSECFSTLDPDSVSKIVDEMDFIDIEESKCDICRQGDVADIFYVIVTGACQVTIDGKNVALLGELDIFGENSLFGGANGVPRREATVTTINDENVQVLALPRKKFDKLLASGTLNEDCMNNLKRVAETRRKENEQNKKIGEQASHEKVAPEKPTAELASGAQKTKELHLQNPVMQQSDQVEAAKVLKKTDDVTAARNWFRKNRKKLGKLLKRCKIEDDPDSLSTIKLSAILKRLRVEQPMALLQPFETKPGSVSKKNFIAWCFAEDTV
jgi:CRP-like cAMP-binding protein